MTQDFAIPISNIVDVRLAAGTEALVPPDQLRACRYALLRAFEHMDEAHVSLPQFDPVALPRQFRQEQPVARLVVGLMNRIMFAGVELFDGNRQETSPVILLSHAYYPPAAGRALNDFVTNARLKRAVPTASESWCPQRRYN